ncbi:HAD-IA family hydrolase [Paenibacillus sp. 22594]|uniref:HAD-IA family hydrolase n=1 Tax=Paenibacillus sp. 22594 TaxID=3453947 RepID=UPI003F87816C
MAIKTIICDLSDVLIKGIEGIEGKISKKIGVSEERISDKLYMYDFSPFWLGKVTEDEFIHSLLSSSPQYDLSVTDFKQMIREHFIEIEGTREIYERLGSKYELILLSVNSKEWVQYMENHFDYERLFNIIIYSYDIGYVKRQKESFRYVLSKYNLNSEEVLLIDDSQRNINTAATLGIKTLRFVNSNQLKKDLERLAI